jgi:hypothetical protein
VISYPGESQHDNCSCGCLCMIQCCMQAVITCSAVQQYICEGCTVIEGSAPASSAACCIGIHPRAQAWHSEGVTPGVAAHNDCVTGAAVWWRDLSRVAWWQLLQQCRQHGSCSSLTEHLHSRPSHICKQHSCRQPRHCIWWVHALVAQHG